MREALMILAAHLLGSNALLALMRQILAASDGFTLPTRVEVGNQSETDANFPFFRVTALEIHVTRPKQRRLR